MTNCERCHRIQRVPVYFCRDEGEDEVWYPVLTSSESLSNDEIKDLRANIERPQYCNL